MKDRTAHGVVLPAGYTASKLFYEVLAEAVARFPAELSQAALPESAADFKRVYGAVLARFEAARAAAAARAEIARFVHTRTQRALRFVDARGEQPLDAYLATKADLPVLTRTQLSGPAGLPLEVPLDGRIHRGTGVRALADALYARAELSATARDALAWLVEHAAAQGGELDLTGQRFVLFGAGAELAPTPLLLRAGASVLWVDLAGPERMLGAGGASAGTLFHTTSAGNLLTQPREIAAAIRAFAEEGPVHVGMFAYAPGASQEWRLGAVMNAIVASLEPSLVRSLSLFISPTTPSVLSAETVRAVAERKERAPGWQRGLARLGALREPSYYAAEGVHVSLSTVSMQGLSYQAAQYVSKICAAESAALFGVSGEGAPLTVSANVAGITRTASLSHPLFQAAFAGAGKLGVRIFDAASTRALSGLLMLHDLLNPHAVGARALAGAASHDAAEGLFSQQIHGGVYSLPYVLEGAIRVAALVGAASRPTDLVRRTPRLPQTEARDAAE